MKYLFIFLCFAFSAKLLAEPCQDAATGRLETSAQKKFLPFKEARAKARLAGISTRREYQTWQKQHPDMPYNPDRAYRKEWTNWGDFLGTGRFRIKKEDVLPFKEARAKARLAGISTRRQYIEWQKDHPDMPSNPPQFYKDQWPGWGDFLGTGRIRTGKEPFLSFEEARQKLRFYGISSVEKYRQWQKQHPDMPSAPDQTYKAQWKGWGYFLGTGRVKTGEENFLSFEEAREKARNAGIKSRKEYEKWQKDHPDMPSHPNRAYAGQWTSWGDFLDTKKVRNGQENFLPFEEAQAKARKAGISSAAQYKEWQKDHPDMPSQPDRAYPDQWTSWGDFLGTGRVIGRKEDFLSFEEAQAKARKAGVKSKKEYQTWQKQHPDMPSRPDQTYKNRWKGWRDFLGK